MHRVGFSMHTKKKLENKSKLYPVRSFWWCFRTHKRYYYQNAATGESQWEYPQADVTVCDEAMDICTTPPPNGAEPTIHMSPPLPPIIGGSPSPPPPPTISDCKLGKKKKCGN